MKLVRFASDTKHRKQWFTGLHFSHPAKLHLSLQLWLIENFTKEGETILDPMAGSGTLLVACSMGRNVICVELESKFVDMMKGNWEKIKQRGCQMGYTMGTATILQGDARNLTGILADKIITSPPFSDTTIYHDFKFMSDTTGDQRERLEQGLIKGHNASVEARKRALEKQASGIPDNPDNISNLPYGQVDKIVSSPPYEGSLQGEPHDGLKDAQKLEELTKANPNRKWKRRTELTPGRMRAWGTMGLGYTKKQVDAVISSPPYEQSVSGETAHGAWQPPEGFTLGKSCEEIHKGYGEGGNIGNLKSGSYLEAMFTVYKECRKCLKSDGLMILVTKNFIRNKQQVGLDLDTIKLCEQAGFTFQNRWYRELQSQSFWRIIYHQKYPEVEPIKFEDVLVFGKKA